MLNHGNEILKSFAFISNKIFVYRYVNKENFEKYGVEYPQNIENEGSKPIKTSVTKITNFMTPQSQKAKTFLLEK